MAFVNRSPRNLDVLKQSQKYWNESEEDQEYEGQLGKSLNKKPPVKGLAFWKFNECHIPKGKISNQDKQNIAFLHLKKQVDHSRDEGQKQRMQYFFKSKCNRDGVPQINKNPAQPENNIKNQDYSQNSIFNVKSYTISKQSKTMNLLKAIKKIKKIDKTPSIPGKMEKFGYVAQSIQDGFKFPQKVSRPRFEGINGDIPGPGEYDYDIRPKIKGAVNYSAQKIKDKNEYESQIEKSGFFALISDQEAMSLHNEKLREWVKKSKPHKISQIIERKVELRTRQKSEYSDSDSGITVYDDDTTPGPGYYNLEKSPTKQFRSKKDKFQKIFFNKSNRFITEKQNEQDSLDFLNPDEMGRKNFYISKLKRDLSLANKSISPDYYQTRQNMQHDVISKVLRNSPNLFNNGIPRIPNSISGDSPGPGFYNLSIPNFKVESIPPQYPQKNKYSGMKSSIKNVFNPSQSELLKNKEKNISHSRIHQRKDQIIETQNYAPFGTTSSKHSVDPNSSVPHCYYPPKRSPLLEKNQQNKAPFNSSSIKGKQRIEKYAAGVGLYDLEAIQSWDTKSYNILFN